MKIISFLAVGLISVVLYAQENPVDFCREAQDTCTEKMNSVVSEFNQGHADFITAPQSAYSGSCWHLNSSYDPQMEHHGAFVFKSNGTEAATNGVFSFFAGTDPYKEMTETQLFDWIGNNGSSMTPVRVQKDQVVLEYNYPESFIGYWFRKSNDKLIVIGKDAGPTYINLVFCEMTQRLK